MRRVFHEDLNFVIEETVEMTRLVEIALADATRALLTSDLALAEQVISGDAEVDRIYATDEERAIEMIARQQPVARDLRTLIASLRNIASLERMGDLAVHVAETARRRYPDAAVPEDMQATFEDMGRTATRMVSLGRAMLVEEDTTKVAEVRALDNVLDAHHLRMFGIILETPDRWTPSQAVDMVMLSRFYERYADHAVSFANRLLYLFTGEVTKAKD